MSVPLRGHQRLDQRSLALHRAIAGKLRADPALIAIALENLDRWSLKRGRSQPYWDAWREILGRPLAQVPDLMLEDSERMAAMPPGHSLRWHFGAKRALGYLRAIRTAAGRSPVM